MVDPDGGRSQNPRTLSTKDGDKPDVPALPTPLDLSYKPATKEEAKIVSSNAREMWEDYKRSLLEQGIMVDETGGKIVRLVKDEPVRPPGMEPGDWEELQALRGESTKYVTVPDTAGQLLFDEWKSSLEDAKEAVSSGGTARSYLATEEDKTSEITRQFKDFDARASLLYDLMDEEQQYGMRADDQNIQNFKAQQDLGMAVVPGGVYGKPSMANSLSSILRPSLPDYVRPDYRLNAAVGLPGAQGFDDPDYNQSGFPAFANGTEAEGYIKVPPVPVVSWPWRKE